MPVPRVSVVIVTYQFDRFIGRAIESALEQRWPASALEVIVVDDGSTDATENVVRGFGERVRYLRHANAGSARSVERGLLAASGDFVCLLDGDDALRADLVARAVELLRAHPNVGLCSVDRRVVDADGRCVAESFNAEFGLRPERGRPLGRLLSRNFVTLSGTMLRASLVPHLLPIPDDAPAEDWWLAVAVACHAELDHLDEALADYRLHGANRNLGRSGAAAAPLVRRDARFRRRMLRELWCSPLVEPRDLLAALDELRRVLAGLEELEPGAARATLPVREEDVRLRDGYLTQLAAATTDEDRVRTAVAAYAHDPFDERATAAATDNELPVLRLDGRELAVPRERLWAFRGGRYYEHSVTLWLDRICAALERPVFYDVGANIGYYAVRLASAAAHVVAFEPVTATFDVLEANVRRNDLPNATALRLALSDTDGDAEINLWSSSGSNTLYPRAFGADHPHRHVGRETIALATVDRLVDDGLQPPDVMKIDIEGAELPALRGARRTLAQHRPHLVVECEADACRDAGYGQQELFDELRGLGYALFGLARDPDDARPHPLTGDIANLVALPPGSPLLAGALGELLGDAVRARVTLARLDDLVADPTLLRGYDAGPEDDATLVVWAPGRRGELVARLPELLCDVGLDGPDAPDILGVARDDVGDLLRGATAVPTTAGRPALPGRA